MADVLTEMYELLEEAGALDEALLAFKKTSMGSAARRERRKARMKAYKQKASGRPQKPQGSTLGRLLGVHPLGKSKPSLLAKRHAAKRAKAKAAVAAKGAGS